MFPIRKIVVQGYATNSCHQRSATQNPPLVEEAPSSGRGRLDGRHEYPFPCQRPWHLDRLLLLEVLPASVRRIMIEIGIVPV